MFDAVVGLTLAGSRFADDRETIRFLNAARNEIAHRTNRSAFESNVRNFCARLWADQKYGEKGFNWQKDEHAQVNALWFALAVLSNRLADYSEDFTKRRARRLA